METLSFTFINLAKSKYVLDVTSDTNYMSMHESKLSEFYGWSDLDMYPSIKYIQNSNVATLKNPNGSEKKISEVFIKTVPIVMMGIKRKAPAKSHDKIEQSNAPVISSAHISQQSIPTSLSESTQQSTQESIPAHNTSSTSNSDNVEPRYTIDDIHMALPAFFAYVMQNPTLMQLMLMQPEAFPLTLSNPIFRSLVREIMLQCSRVRDAVTSRNDISIVIPTLTSTDPASGLPPPQPQQISIQIEPTNDDNDSDDESESNDSNDDDDNNTNENNNTEHLEPVIITQPQGIGMNNITTLMSMLSNTGLMQQNSSSSLTEDDELIINDLMELGFPRAQCVQAYLACEKNAAFAANYLLSNYN
jgi:hypothetical protein